MNKERFAANRLFLKDLVRQQVDFSQTPQSRHLPPPPPQKPCPAETVRIQLPDGREALDRFATQPLAKAIIHRESVRRYSDASFTLEELSLLLWATQGVRKTMGPAVALRAVPSAGARHALETYVVVNRVDGLPVGLYRYLPFDGQLAQLLTGRNIGLEAARACLGQGFVAASAATFFWTAIPARMEWRYDLAAHKVIALDAGHVGQNLYLACQGIGAGACCIAAYDQQACDQLLGIDGEEEFTLYIGATGKC